jgi:hypothetical protein
MQGHESAEMIAAMGVCIGIAIAVVLVMLSALLISGNVVHRRKWMPRYIIINGILAVIFCSAVILSQSHLDIIALGKLALVILIVALWAATVTRIKWCSVCGERMIGGGTLENKKWFIVQKKICPTCLMPPEKQF